MRKEDFNIMESVTLIENLKADLICLIGQLFKLLSRGSNVAQNAILECISGAIIILYILANRLGYSFIAVDDCIKKKLKNGITEGDYIEKEGRDLSRLYSHLKEKR